MTDLNQTIRAGLQLGNRVTDFFRGVNSPIPHEKRNLLKNWKQFRSLEEDQFNKRTDFSNCTNQSGENQWEAQANWALDNKLWPSEALEFFNGKNSMGVSYIVNGRFVISTRFNSKQSGTRIGFGNWLYKAQDSLRKDGVVPDSVWPTNPEMSGEEYYSEIKPEVIALGKESLKFYDWLYEFLSDNSAKSIDKALEHAPVQIAIAVCPGWNTGVVPVCVQDAIHAVLVEDVEDINYSFNILDHYQPYTKRLLPGYIINSAVKGILYPKGKNQPTDQAMLAPLYKDIVFGERGEEVSKLKFALQKCGWLPDYKYNPSVFDEYDAKLATVVFNFQLANVSRVFLEMILSLKGRRVGPRTRAVINEIIKF